MTLARYALAMVLIVTLSGATKPPTPANGQISLTDEADMKLTHGGYDDSLDNAYWASGTGPKIVPILADMLLHEKTYINNGDASAFPFNAIWALGRIATPQALAALKKYQAGKHSHDARLAIKACELRLKMHEKEVGVTIREDARLYVSNDHDSKVLKILKPGTPVRVMAYRIPGPEKQVSARGGRTTFDHVQLLPKGPVGWLERAGDDFATIY